MATPYCDFTHFQYSFSAEGACQKFKKWRARARVFFQDCVILPGALQRLVYLKRSVCVFADFPERTEEKPQDRVKPLLGPNFRNIERKR